MLTPQAFIFHRFRLHQPVNCQTKSHHLHAGLTLLARDGTRLRTLRVVVLSVRKPTPHIDILRGSLCEERLRLAPALRISTAVPR